MGYNTEVLVITTCIERDVINKLSSFLYGPDSYYQPENKIKPFQEFIEDYPYSRAGIHIYHGEFKNFDKSGFLIYLESLEWYLLDNIQVMYKSDDEVRYSLYVINESGKFISVYTDNKM